MGILETIHDPSDIKKLDNSQLPALCQEIRDFLVSSVSHTGGHFAANLGVVELTVALHRVFDTSRDRLIFDVGHQCYVHKILTGRREQFDRLRKLDGLAGFPRPSESLHDAFIAGHASNSVSVALGMARARTLQQQHYSVIALLGDGALTGGLAYEALNDAGESGEPLIVILNDNGMSIAENVGGISKHLAQQRVKPSYHNAKQWYRNITAKIPGGKAIYRFAHNVKTVIKQAILHCGMFEEMGFQYMGPIDGHDLDKLTYFLGLARDMQKPVLLHVRTVKGKGYAYSEQSPGQYHGVGSFNQEKGLELSTKASFSEAFGHALVNLAEKDQRICAITAAMQAGTGLNEFAKRFPQRFFDVGIAEGHGAAMAGGMAMQGMIPVFAVYSTFLQRAYDMLIHDIALQNLHVVLAVDRAGIVGEDGETHNGVFDVNFLCGVPNMTVFCPACYEELQVMLETAIHHVSGPVAIRYPRGGQGAYRSNKNLIGERVLQRGTDITLVGYGVLINNLLNLSSILAEQGISAEVIKLDCICPLDCRLIDASVAKTGRLLVAEDCIANGSIGQKIAAHLESVQLSPQILLKNLGDGVIPSGNVAELHRRYGLDGAGLAAAVMEAFYG